MADDCCQNKACGLETLKKSQRRMLWTVLIINAAMFVVELAAGLRGQSLALSGDALDMLGDALVYASSLYVLNMGSKAHARSALFKGLIMFGSAVAILARALHQFFAGTVPAAGVIGMVGLLALGANLVCLALLTRHREDNINMSSVWLCSRNDIIANTSVLAASGLVFLTQSPMPDLVVGVLITVVFAKSSGHVLSQSLRELR